MGTFVAYLFRPVDASFLAVFRIGFGALMLFESVNYGLFLCLDCMYHSSSLLFKYHRFEWVAAWPTPVLQAQWLAMAVAAVGIMCGYYYRWAMLLFTLGFSYMFLLDQALYLNHFYMVILFCVLMMVVPANVYWSVDAKRNASLASPVVPYWTKFLLAAQLEIILLIAGLVKLNGDWLRLEPLRMWLTAKSQQHGEWLQFLTQDWGVFIAAYGVTALHLIGAPLLLWKKTRLFVLGIYCLFHTINMFVFNIGIFPWLTLFASLLFFDADWPKQFWRFVGVRFPGVRFPRVYSRLPPPVTAGPAQWAGSSTSGHYAIAALIAAWLLIQILIPFRHLMLPGNVAWNEAGHRFSWRMKLRSKRGTARFRVQRTDGQSWIIDPGQHLNRKQAYKMACIPDLLWQYAQYLETLKRVDGHQVAVYADVMCSLNNRKMARLVKPDVDLTRIPRQEPVSNWIEPLTLPLR